MSDVKVVDEDEYEPVAAEVRVEVSPPPPAPRDKSFMSRAAHANHMRVMNILRALGKVT